MAKLKLRDILNILLGLLLMSLVTSAQALDIQGMGYRLGVGDRLKVSVFGHDELSGSFVVNGNGEIVMPLVRRVNSLGLTTDQLSDAITRKLRPDYLVNPRVTVELLSYRPFYIIGEVNKPGSYPYVEGMTVLNAIALAGGYARRANKGKVIVERGANDRKKFKAKPTSHVKPGDIITVRERFF